MITWLILGVAQAIYITCPDNSVWAGQYDRQLNQIKICENFPWREHIENHELWHWLWYQRLTHQEKARFKRMIAKEECVNYYACTSEEENFAENVRIVLSNKPKTPTQFFIRNLLYKYWIK